MISCGARPGEGWLLGHPQRALGSGYHSGLRNQKTKRGWIGCIETKISRKKHDEFDAESCRGWNISTDGYRVFFVKQTKRKGIRGKEWETGFGRQDKRIIWNEYCQRVRRWEISILTKAHHTIANGVKNNNSDMRRTSRHMAPTTVTTQPHPPHDPFNTTNELVTFASPPPISRGGDGCVSRTGNETGTI